MIHVVLFATETFFEARPDDLTRRTLLVIKCYLSEHMYACMSGPWEPQAPLAQDFQICGEHQLHTQLDTNGSHFKKPS